MTRLIVWATLALSVAATTTSRQSARASLTVTNATALRNNGGSFRCALWSESRGFPMQVSLAKAHDSRRPRGRSATCIFTNLPPGQYAVSVLHDENDNQRMDTNIFGIPLEGYGISNDAPPGAMSAPPWTKAVFDLRSGANSLRLKIRY